MEIFIGREVNGKNDIKVPLSHTSVSRSHARFYINDKGVYVEDTSSNGTYVNGNRIKTKRFIADDTIVLGIEDTQYHVNVSNIISLLTQGKNANRTDFSEEFLQLKTVYNDYLKEYDRVGMQLKLKNALPRLVITVFAIVGILNIEFKDPSTRIVLSMGAGVIGMVASVFGTKDSLTRSKRDKINIKYNRKYICPKCQTKLQIQRKSWEELYEEATCLNSKCDVRFR